jgi:3-hydroxybutyrate dehydrogenase
MSIIKYLEGKSAIITGSTSGIGLAIAKRLAELGANIVINGFGDKTEIDKLIQDIEKHVAGKVLYSSADVSKLLDIENMVKEALGSFGTIDIIVNNAGIQFVAPIHEFPTEKWDAILNINLSAAYKLIKAVLPGMLANNWGRVINIASTHGVVASAYKSAYVAAKHGLVGLTKVVALETAETNITCNAICPGYVKTPLVDKQIAEQSKAHKIPEDRVIREILLKAQPNKKFIQAENIADFTAFLCSDAGSGMTGEILMMDGGWTAQ